MVNNASIDDSISLSSVIGDYSIRGGELTLKLVILDSNIERLPQKIGQFFPNLVFFGVVKSNVKLLKRDNFNLMEMVKTLDLRRNLIAKLPDDVFFEMRGLRKIDLSGNLIKTLPNSAFTSSLHLMRFIANENMFELFDFEIFRQNLKLYEIHLWKNKIKAIRFDGKKFNKLASIDLRGNICIDEIFYLTSENPASWLQMEINLKCNFYIRDKGQLILRRSKRP